MKNLFLVICFAALAFMADARPHFSLHDTVPLYSRQTEAAKYKIGESIGRYYPDVTLHDENFSATDEQIKYELNRDSTWVKLTFEYSINDSKRTRTAYSPAENFDIEYYEYPEYRKKDGDSMYELLEDNLFYSDGDTSVIEKGEVIKVILLYDNGTVNCKYDGEYGYIDNAKIVLTDKNPPYFKSDEWYKLLYNILFGFLFGLLFIAALVPVLLCDRYYKRNMHKQKGMWKLLDVLSGLLFGAIFVVLLIVCREFTHDSVFKTIIQFLPRIESDFWYIIALCAYLLLLYLVWTLIIRFFVHFGANWVIHTITFLIFAALTLWAFVECVDKTGAWGILGFFLIPFVSFIGYITIYLRYMRFNRCPRCHATGGKNIENLGTDDLGTTTSHAIETRTVKDPYQTETTKYDVYTTKQHFCTHLQCKKCGHNWDVNTSHEIGSRKDFKSHDVTKRW